MYIIYTELYFTLLYISNLNNKDVSIQYVGTAICNVSLINLTFLVDENDL